MVYIIPLSKTAVYIHIELDDITPPFDKKRDFPSQIMKLIFSIKDSASTSESSSSTCKIVSSDSVILST